MRKLLIYMFLFALAACVPLAFFLQPDLANNQVLALATFMVSGTGCIVVASFIRFLDHVDNPYYEQMVKRKREEIRLCQKLARMEMKRT